MKILAIERDDSACNMYRIKQPLAKLQEHGMASVLFIEEGAMLGTDYAFSRLMEADIVAVHRPASEEWFNFIKKCQKAGKIIICDYDDDPFNTSPLNPYYQYIGTEEVVFRWPDGTEEMLWSKNPVEHGGRFINLEQNIRRRDLFRASFNKADMVTTTTDILQARLMNINKNTVVLPNLVDFSQYPQVECVKKEIRIGWQGGSSHYEDLYMIHKAVKEILRKYENVKFIFWGDARMYGLFREIPWQRIECYDWVKQLVYPYALACKNLDIGLCPVIENEFNTNKSAIKHFEYSVVKAATIASEMEPYSLVVKDNETGLLVKEDKDFEVTTKKWFDAMERLILDVQLRNKLASNAYDNIYENHNADKKAYLWLNAYESILKKDLVTA